MSKWLNSLQPTAALFLRLAIGACLAYFGYLKVLRPGGLDRHAHMVAAMHLPYWLGYVSAFAEFVGGICLILGLLTRLAAFLIAINMLVAFFFVGIHNQPNMYFFHLALASGAFMLTCYGAGPLSLDRKLGFA